MRFGLCVAVLLTVLQSPGWAQETVLLSPQRVVMAPNDNVTTVALTNRGNQPKIYTVSLRDEVMQPDGQLLAATTEFPYSIRRMLRFAPQKVVLQPGERQVVRLLLRRPAGLADGDYHSHLVFTQQDASTLVSPSTPNEPLKGPKFLVNTLVNMAIPVVVQHGNITSALQVKTLEVARQPEGGNRAVLHVARTGNAMAVGKLSLVAEPGGQDLIRPMNLRLYREVSAYTLPLELNPLGQTYRGAARLTLTAGLKEDAPVVYSGVYTFK